MLHADSYNLVEREFVEVPFQDEPTVIRGGGERVLKNTAGRKAVGVDDLQIELLKEVDERKLTAIA